MQGQKKKEVKIYPVSISTKMFRRHLKGVFAPKYNYIYFRSTCVINKFCISLTCLEFFNSKGHVKFWFFFFFPLPCFFHHVFDIHVLAPFCFKSYLPVFCICFFLMLIEAISQNHFHLAILIICILVLKTMGHNYEINKKVMFQILTYPCYSISSENIT